MENRNVIRQEKINEIIARMSQVIVGKEEVIRLTLTALLARGHVLIEDVPGVGKTMLVKSLTQSLDCQFKRIQFTPDLLPADITGVSIYHPETFQFEFHKGPIFGNIVLADEINRTPPKTQSALLESMEEGSVTVEGRTIPLEQPFFVLATQNPIEYEGTYALPEAQLDRFLLKLEIGYPSFEEELELLMRTSLEHPIHHLQPVVTKDEVLHMQREAQKIYISSKIQRYIVDLVTRTREHEDLELGVSPRGSIALMQAAKAYAYIGGRDFVLPDDVKYLAPYVLSHRILLTAEAAYHGRSPEEVLQEVIEKVAIPIQEDYFS